MEWRTFFLGLVTLLAGLTAPLPSAKAADGPVVLELFTSQSCSSCPPADALLKKLVANDSAILALSYHVDYWDYLSWKDTYSSPANTQRQRVYAEHLPGGVYTPELVINGTDGIVGSHENEVNQTVAGAHHLLPVSLSISLDAGGLNVTISPTGQSTVGADIWEMRFDRYARTQVNAGENGGRMLESINNVTSIRRLGTLQAGSTSVTLDPLRGDGVAILVQEPGQARILGAASYSK